MRDDKFGNAESREHTFRCTLEPVRLHGDMSIEMVQCAVCLFASIPTTLVHTLDFLVSSSRSLVLLRTGNGNEGVDLR